MAQDRIKVVAKDFDGTQTGAHLTEIFVKSIFSDSSKKVKENHTHNILAALKVPAIEGLLHTPIHWDMRLDDCKHLADQWVKKCQKQGLVEALRLDENATYATIVDAILDQHLCNQARPYCITINKDQVEHSRAMLNNGKSLIDVTFTHFPHITYALRTRPVDKGGIRTYRGRSKSDSFNWRLSNKRGLFWQA